MKQASEQKLQEQVAGLSVETVVYGATSSLAVWLFSQLSHNVGQPVTLFGAAPEGLAPDAMPRFVLLAIAGVAALGAVQSYRKKAVPFELPGPAVAVTCAVSFLFAALLVPLGFVLSSALTVLLLAAFLGARKPVGLAVSGLAVPIALYVIFTRVLHIALPPGLLGF